jgi:hypothetical protein
MIAGCKNDLALPGSFAPSAECLLLIRAPSDREIYDAFRAIAAHAKQTCIEHLWIEGDLPLTAGLCAPQPPPTVERLLNADCEMIDKLELEFGGFRWTYIRSGGHAPFRELRAAMQSALSQLPVVSHSGSGELSGLISEIQADSGGSFRTPSDEIGASRIWTRS